MAEPADAQRRNLEINEAAFAAFDRNDADAVLKLADRDIEIFSSPELANSGSFHGHDGYVKWLGDWLEAWDDFTFDVTGFEPVGQRHVVTKVHQSATGKVSGVPVEMDLAFMTEIDGERFVALHLYPDAEQARAAAERREAA
jgi:ketosteroid isomerase-like protein